MELSSLWEKNYVLKRGWLQVQRMFLVSESLVKIA